MWIYILNSTSLVWIGLNEERKHTIDACTHYLAGSKIFTDQQNICHSSSWTVCHLNPSIAIIAAIYYCSYYARATQWATSIQIGLFCWNVMDMTCGFFMYRCIHYFCVLSTSWPGNYNYIFIFSRRNLIIFTVFRIDISSFFSFLTWITKKILSWFIYSA